MALFTPKSATELRDILMRDAYLAAKARDPDAEPPVEPGGDWDLLFSAVANMGMLALANVEFHNRQADYRTADGDRLDAHLQANGLPEQVPAPSTGRVTMSMSRGIRTVPNRLTGKLPSGKLVYVDGLHLAVSDGDTVSVITDDGADTEAPAGTVIEWINAPAGIDSEATVSAEHPLSGGQDAETRDRKIARIANAKQFPIAPGNPGQLRDAAFKALGTVQQAFVYPALGGPSSVKLVVTKAFSRAVYDYSRALTSTALSIVRARIHSIFPGGEQYVIATVTEELLDAAIQATLPDAVGSGGDGTGWLDVAPWPLLEGGDTRVTITVLSPAGHDIRVNASTTTPPINGTTQIAWFAPSEQQFHVKRVMGHAGGTGAWDLTLDSPLVDQTETAAAVGDFVSPAMVNAEEYAKTWLSQVEILGPSENTSDANRLPRALRLPLQREIPGEVNNTQLLALNAAHPEMVSPVYSYRSATGPSLPATVSDNPNLLIPRHFGIYPP